MFIKTNRFAGALEKIRYFYKVQVGNEFHLRARMENDSTVVIVRKTEQEIDDFLEVLTDAIEDGQEIFRE